MIAEIRKWGERNWYDGVNTSPWMKNSGYLGLGRDTWRLVWWVPKGMHFLGEAYSRSFPFNIKKFNSWTSPLPKNSLFFAPYFPLCFLFRFLAKTPLILFLYSSKIPSIPKISLLLFFLFAVTKWLCSSNPFELFQSLNKGNIRCFPRRFFLFITVSFHFWWTPRGMVFIILGNFLCFCSIIKGK